MSSTSNEVLILLYISLQKQLLLLQNGSNQVLLQINRIGFEHLSQPVPFIACKIPLFMGQFLRLNKCSRMAEIFIVK